MTTAAERKRAARAFKMRGLTLQSSALDALLNVLRREGDSSSSSRASNEALLAIIDGVKDRLLRASGSGGANARAGVVTTALLEEVVAELSRDAGDVADEAVQLLDAFKTPRLEYDAMRKAFSLVKLGKGEGTLYGEAVDKVDMFAQRYALVRQRILRQDVFRPTLVRGRAAQNAGGTHALTPVESLLGRGGVRYLLGMIVQVEEGKYYLEDHTAQVPLNFSQASLLTDGFVTENSIVLVEGEAVDGVLHVHNMGSPIVENRADAVGSIGLQNTDIFDSIGSLSELEKLQEQEIEHGEDGTFVILSDVHLDSPSVLEKIERMLEGYGDFEPLPIFVFMGNFSSRPLDARAAMGCFDDLANVIGKFPSVARDGRFVFVPGPNDPWHQRSAAPRTHPERLHGQFEVEATPAGCGTSRRRSSFFRDDLVGKMRRHCLLEPREDNDDDGDDEMLGEVSGQRRLSRHAIKTVLDQGHLSPLPLSASPVYWKHDHSLRLYPFPDALVVGDRVDQYYENYEGCDAVNPSPFSNGFNFRGVPSCGRSERYGDQV
ncbi:hypothetical protein ACHAXT_008945 [Thalassiosira profunda]